MLISTGKSTILSDFSDLETKSIYEHANGETTDFQFFTNSNVFVEVNKKSGLEVMRIKETNEIGAEIQRVLKLKTENAYCVACAKRSVDEIALGLSNGQVRIYNYRHSEVLYRYAGEKMNSVVFVDFNASDEYIAATHESGIVNIYSNKTRTKLESINIDGVSSLARFHPSKRFHLAIASHKGAVTVYDVGAKKKAFHVIDSHGAPVRDLCMSYASPDTLMSVGYDCVVNIFDTRRKGNPHKIQQSHPLSAVALSDCGQFFCVGNLKGDLITYDVRNIKSQLGIKRVHNGAVNRVAFVPKVSKDTQDTLSHIRSSLAADVTIGESTGGASVERVDSSGGLNSEHRKSIVTSLGRRDSFFDFLDFHSNKGVEKTSSRTAALAGRDSFDEVLTRKPSWTNRASMACSNLSPIKSNNESCLADAENIGVRKEQPIIDANFKESTPKNNTEKPNLMPLREQNINITPVVKSVQFKDNSSENLQLMQDLQHDKHCESFEKAETADALLTRKENNTPIVKVSLPMQDNAPPISSSLPQSLTEVVAEIKNLRSDMEARFKELESELKFESERNKWQIFSQANDLWCKQYQIIEEIRGAMMFLLQTDPFVQEFARLKEENQKLKEQLAKVLKKN